MQTVNCGLQSTLLSFEEQYAIAGEGDQALVLLHHVQRINPAGWQLVFERLLVTGDVDQIHLARCIGIDKPAARSQRHSLAASANCDLVDNCPVGDLDNGDIIRRRVQSGSAATSCVFTSFAVAMSMTETVPFLCSAGFFDGTP